MQLKKFPAVHIIAKRSPTVRGVAHEGVTYNDTFGNLQNVGIVGYFEFLSPEEAFQDTVPGTDYIQLMKSTNFGNNNKEYYIRLIGLDDNPNPRIGENLKWKQLYQPIKIQKTMILWLVSFIKLRNGIERIIFSSVPDAWNPEFQQIEYLEQDDDEIYITTEDNAGDTTSKIYMATWMLARAVNYWQNNDYGIPGWAWGSKRRG